MKKRRRLRIIEDLLAQMQSTDFDRREHALFQLGLMLERSNQRADAPAADWTACALTRQQLRLMLSSDEQAQVAEHLIQLALHSPESRVSAIWTMGKVAADILLEPLLELILAAGGQLTGEAAYQACCALGKCLEHYLEQSMEHSLKGNSERASASIQASLRDARLLSILKSWRSRGDGRLQQSAGEALALIARWAD